MIHSKLIRIIVEAILLLLMRVAEKYEYGSGPHIELQNKFMELKEAYNRKYKTQIKL